MAIGTRSGSSAWQSAANPKAIPTAAMPVRGQPVKLRSKDGAFLRQIGTIPGEIVAGPVVHRRLPADIISADRSHARS